MLISRRATLASASALAAVSATSASGAVFGPQAETIGRSQKIQHLLVHPDEAGGRMVYAFLSLEAPDTAWKTAGMMDEATLHDTTATLRRRGYGLRRVNAFQTHRGMRYAAIWQYRRAAPARVQTGMDVTAFRAAAAWHAQQGLAIGQIDAARTEAGTRVSAIWEPASNNRQKVYADLSDADFTQHVSSHAAEGLVPRFVAGYASGDGARFAAVFDSARSASVQTDLSVLASEFPSRSHAMNAAGFILRDASGHAVNGRPFITAVWEKA